MKPITIFTYTRVRFFLFCVSQLFRREPPLSASGVPQLSECSSAGTCYLRLGGREAHTPGLAHAQLHASALFYAHLVLHRWSSPALLAPRR